MTKRLLLIPSLLLLLNSCAPPPPPETMEAESVINNPITPAEKAESKKRITATKHLNHWTIHGAIAASSEHKSWTASVNWKQTGLNNYKLHLFGPLGGGSVIVEKRGNIITYQDGPKRVRTTNIDELFYKETGIRVPLHNLYYWVRGVKAPGAVQASTQDNAGHYLSLTQGGYTVQYSGYKTVDGVDVPTKLNVSGPKGHLKLVIKNWQI